MSGHFQLIDEKFCQNLSLKQPSYGPKVYSACLRKSTMNHLGATKIPNASSTQSLYSFFIIELAACIFFIAYQSYVQIMLLSRQPLRKRMGKGLKWILTNDFHTRTICYIISEITFFCSSITLKKNHHNTEWQLQMIPFNFLIQKNVQCKIFCSICLHFQFHLGVHN